MLMDDKLWRADIAQRLRALQQALDATHREMADYCGCGTTSWDSYVNEHVLFPVEYALRLQERFGVKMEWFYNADASRNPIELQGRIDAAMRDPKPPSRGRRSKKIKHPVHK